MNRVLAYPLAGGASLLFHLGLLGMFWLAVMPDPVVPQLTPESRLSVEAYEVDRSAAAEARPEAPKAAEESAAGPMAAQGEVPQSRARPVEAPPERAAEAEAPAERLAESAAGGDALAPAEAPSETLAAGAPPAPALAPAEAPAEALVSEPPAPEPLAPAAAEVAVAAAAAPPPAVLAPAEAPAAALAPAEAPAATLAAAAPPSAALPPAEAEAETLDAAVAEAAPLAPSAPLAEAAVAAEPPDARLAAAAPAPEALAPAEPAPAALPEAEPVATAAPAARPEAAPGAEIAAPSTPAAAAPAEATELAGAAPEAQAAADQSREAAVGLPGIPPPAEKGTATLAWAGPDGTLDPKSLDAIQAFMQPGDAAAAASEVRDGIEGLLASVPCARLQVEFDPGTGSLTLTGHIPEDGLREPVLAALQAQVGSGIPVTQDLRILPRPQCGALSGIGAVGLPQSTELQGNPRIIGADGYVSEEHYTAGQYVNFTMQGLDYPAYVYVDYFFADGTVAHLVPNDSVPLTVLPPGAEFRIGNRNPKPGELALQVGPPYGQEIAVAFAASVPLYEGLRPMVEPADAYLAELATLVAAARAANPGFQGEWVYFFISTSEN